MNRKTKKGFTIVELVIVIAVIAILAAVLIPTFSNVIKKAKVSNDVVLVRNLNTALATDGKKHNTMHDAILAAKNYGFDLPQIVAKVETNKILWDSKNDVFCYEKEGVIEYIPESNLTYRTVNYNTANYVADQVNMVDFWMIANELDEQPKYSIYAGNDWDDRGNILSNLQEGFDVGDNNITSINYVGRSGISQNVIIRTNDFATTLTVNDSSAQGKIYHYGNLGQLTVINCAMESYHEMGTVGYAEVRNGHVEVEQSATISLVFANTNTPANLKITNNGTIANAQASSDEVKQSATISGVDFNRESAATVPTDDINNAVEDTHQKNCEHANVKITKEAKDPTCTETGWTAEKTCADCGKVFESEVISTTAHTLTYTEAKAATCGENGNREYWSCSVCGKLFADADATQETTANAVVISKTGAHNYENHQCTVCGTAEEGWEQFVGKVTGDKLSDGAFRNDTTITTIVIPDGVTAIGTEAFKGCTSLTSVTIPTTVTKIGQSAFQGCTSLERIVIPDGVTMVDGKAFFGCTKLTTVEIGKDVSSIVVGTSDASDSFGNTKLTTITVDPENTTYQSAGNALLTKDGTKLVLGVASSVIPSSVQTIGKRAFYMRQGLSSVEIPSNVTTIEEYAFAASSLTSVTIPSSVTTIGKCAFMECAALTTVTLNANITEIAEGLFSRCSSLNSVTIPATVTKIGVSAFNSCTSLASIEIPASVKTIGSQAFMGSGLTSVTLSDTNWRTNTISNISRYLTSSGVIAQYLTGVKFINGSTSLAVQEWTHL